MWTFQDLDLKIAMHSNDHSTRSQLRFSEGFAQSHRTAQRVCALHVGSTEHVENTQAARNTTGWHPVDADDDTSERRAFT